MTSERWEQINRLWDAALELGEEERHAFLESHCQGDEDLRREVESLLAYDRQAQQFINQPALQLTAEKVAAEPPSLVGKKLGPYQIQGVLGAGGMGEVYKAKDTRLNRTVAIKILPRLLSERTDLRQRFEREARAIASLNHPNICALYDIGRQDRIDFLVMEYLDGETLSQRLKKGALPTEQLLRTAIEITTALVAWLQIAMYHAVPMSLQALSPVGRPSSSLSPLARGTTGGGAAGDPGAGTETKSLTEEGMILGTLEYMAPEASKASLIAAILTRQPPAISSLQPLTPAAFDRLVKRCLEKDPDERWQSTRDLTSELKWIAEAGQIPGARDGSDLAWLAPVSKGRKREQLAWLLALAFLVAAIACAVSYLRLAQAPAQDIISEIGPPENAQFDFFGGGPPALSPDGAAIAFSAPDARGNNVLWVRSFDSLVAQSLPGTQAGLNPFWSANSRTLGFCADGKLKTIEVSGGPARIMADAPAYGGGSWNREGTLLFVPDSNKGLYLLAASDSTPVPVFKLDRPKHPIYWPKFLPDGKHFLYYAVALDPASSGTYLASLDGTENRLLLKGDSRATYASGYLLYLFNKTLMAQALDLERGQPKGSAQPVAARVGSDSSGNGFLDVSENGVLIYQRDMRGDRRITWFDRSGKELAAGEGGSYESVRLSPDGGKLGFNDTNGGIWVEELARGVRLRLGIDPFSPPDDFYSPPVWSPNTSRVLSGLLSSKTLRNVPSTSNQLPGSDEVMRKLHAASDRVRDRQAIYQINSSGTGLNQPRIWAKPEDPQVWPTSWSADGKWVLFVRGSVGNEKQHPYLWVMLADGLKGRDFVRPFVSNAFDGQFSPDGRWVAYTSYSSGRAEVYVERFDAAEIIGITETDLFSRQDAAMFNPGAKWQISTNGGWGNKWRGDGKEIFFEAPKGQIMAVQVDGRGKSFKVLKEQVLFQAATVPAKWSQFDVTPDGKRFVMITQKGIKADTPLTLVMNWTARLGRQ